MKAAAETRRLARKIAAQLALKAVEGICFLRNEPVAAALDEIADSLRAIIADGPDAPDRLTAGPPAGRPATPRKGGGK